MKNRYPLCVCSPGKISWFSIWVTAVFLFFFSHITCAQSTVAQKEAQQRMEKTAAAYFEQGDLVSAYPIYSQLLSIYPHDPTYNYRLGACMLYANGDKKKAVKYILYALKESSSVDDLAYYYLGRAMHLNYEFDQAIRYYLKFQEVASSGELKRYPVTRLIEMCRNGKELLATSQELDVLRKKSLSFSIFWEGYSMHSNGGTLITEPDEFKSKVDKKNKVVNLMYLTPDKKEAFFSSYGNKEDNGKDIYVIRKKADGTWGAPENLGPVINTSFDEDYPVYDVPRNTLYFCSKGHNSMGGYDIFSSVYNDTTQTWSDPVNLDFPINTPDDDILLVPDTSGQFAFFASARSSPQGKLEVYKIALHLHPPGTVVVAGRVSQTGTKTPVYSIVVVRDSTTGRIIAVDTTSSQDGSYSFNLSKGGKYIFTIEDSAHHSQTKSVVLAAGEAEQAVEQNIELDPSGAVKIENHAAIVSPDSGSRLALQFIKNAAQMEVNVDTNSSLQTLIAQSRANKPNNNQTTSFLSPVKQIQNAATVSSSSAGKTSPVDSISHRNADTASSAIAENNNSNGEGLKLTPKETPSNSASDSAGGNNQIAINNTTTSIVGKPRASQKSVRDSIPGDSNMNNNQVEVTNTNITGEPVVSQKSVADSIPSDSGMNNSMVAAIPNNPVNQPFVSQKPVTDSSPGNAKKPDSSEVAKQDSNPSEIPSVTQNQTFVSKGDSITAGNANSGSSPSNKVVSNNVTSVVSNATMENHSTDSSVAGNSVQVVKNNQGSKLLTKADSVKADQLKQDEQQLSDKATDAMDYAANQAEQAQYLQRKLDALTSRRRHKKDSVVILSTEIEAATQHAMDAYKLAAQYKSGAESKQSEINKTITNNDTSVSGNSSSPRSIMMQQAGQIKEDSAELANDNAEDTKEINEIDQESANFLEQARQATDTAQRSALLQQVDDLSKSKAAKQDEINGNNAQLQQLHNEYAWLNENAKKADSVSLFTGNSEDTAHTGLALQQEIDLYTAKSAGDSALGGEPENQPAANGDVNSVTQQNYIQNTKHRKHSRRKKNNMAQSPVQNSVMASAAQPADSSDASNVTNQPVVENVQADHNVVTDTNSEAYRQVPVNNANIPPVAQQTPAGNTITPSVAQEPTEANPAPLQVSKKTGYHRDSSIYYRAPNTAILDSLANAAPVSPGEDISAQSTEQPAFSPASAVQYSDDMAIERQRKSQQYFAAASQLSDTAKKVRREATEEPDKTKAAQLSAKADSLDALTFQLNLRGAEIEAKANTLQYSAGILQLKTIMMQTPDSNSDKVTNAQLKLKDARDSYNKFAWERDSAYNSSIPAHKQQYMEAAVNDLAIAIVKQQAAIYLYKQADSIRTANTSATAINSDKPAKNVSPDNAQSPISQPSDKANNDNAVASANNPASNANPGKTEPVNNNDGNQQADNIKQPATDNFNKVAATQQPAQPDNSQPFTGNNNPATIKPAAPGKTVTENSPSSESASTTETIQPVNSPGKVSSIPSPELTSIFQPAVFGNVNTSVYSESKPIPVDPVLPSGLIFGVQVGAFRNPIPPGLFKGFEPIIGLRTPEGFVRYVAGTFKTFEPAKAAASKIRGLGYSGAFVVAYYNGKRISIKDALAMLGVSAPPVAATPENQQPTAVAQERPTPVDGHDNTVAVNDAPPIFSGKVTSPTRRNLIDTRRRDIKAIKDSVPPAADNINDVKGLVYTVQVGSFSKRKGFTRLQKIKHLYYWASPDGTIKYNSGVYSNLADARAAKDIIVANTAVKDAFVTAYYKGRRITPQQAAILLGKGVSSVLPKAVNNNSQPVENKTEEPDNSFAASSSDKVIYSVQIASFAGKLPVDTVNKLLTYASEGIEPHKEEGGITTYYAGRLTSYESAESLRQIFLKGGFARATVVAFYRGKKISVEEARSIKNQ